MQMPAPGAAHDRVEKEKKKKRKEGRERERKIEREKEGEDFQLRSKTVEERREVILRE